ncbi:MAG: hypothetical protein HYU86_12035 [Chloroflexi bacterium]|nr:hypothetical protein [Chloroflexota bacterium]
MERIFYVRCPSCQGRFCCSYELRFATVELVCPFCKGSFPVTESPEIDDRWR